MVEKNEGSVGQSREGYNVRIKAALAVGITPESFTDKLKLDLQAAILEKREFTKRASHLEDATLFATTEKQLAYMLYLLDAGDFDVISSLPDVPHNLEYTPVDFGRFVERPPKPVQQLQPLRSSRKFLRFFSRKR